MPSTSAAPALVSVVMVVHNGERFLREAVESVLSQSLSELELVVVDDGSTDATGAMLEDYAADDPRVVVHRQANAGVASARNRGFGLASAPLVATLDADDVSLPRRLEQQYVFMEEHVGVAAVGGAVAFIDVQGREFGRWQYPLTDAEIRTAFGRTTPFANSATMIRSDAFRASGGYRTHLAPAEDVDLWLRIADRHELANLPDVVVRYRVHPDQATVRACEAQALGSLAARLATRARAGGGSDPLDAIDSVDAAALRRLGATDYEICSAVVENLTWTARTLGRAGYAADSDRLFGDARRRARADDRFSELAAEVHRQHARLHRERGRRMRFVLEAVRARRAVSGARRR